MIIRQKKKECNKTYQLIIKCVEEKRTYVLDFVFFGYIIDTGNTKNKKGLEIYGENIFVHRFEVLLCFRGVR